MFVNLALTTHQAEVMACLNLLPGGFQRLGGIRSSLSIGDEVQSTLTRDLADAILVMLHTPEGTSSPLERFILRRSPTVMGNRGPIVVLAAMAATLTQEIRQFGQPAAQGIMELGTYLGMRHPEEYLDFLVKVAFAREALGLAAINPLQIYFGCGLRLNGRHMSTFSAGILNALEDLDPWRDPPLLHRSGLPSSHPLQRIVTSGLPTLLFHAYYRAEDPAAGMVLVAQRLAELWAREADPGQVLSAEGKAYALLRALFTRCVVTHLDFWGPWPSTLDHVAAAVGSSEAVHKAAGRLGFPQRAAIHPLKEEVPVA